MNVHLVVRFPNITNTHTQKKNIKPKGIKRDPLQQLEQGPYHYSALLLHYVGCVCIDTKIL